MIHICFGLRDADGRYSKFTGTAMLSLFENSSAPPQSTCIHILHDNTLTQDNREKFIYLAGQYHQLVKFYNVEELCRNEIKNVERVLQYTQYSVGAMYRLFVSHILPREVEKIIYLDSDIVVNLDIVELWRIELGDKIFGAVTAFLNKSGIQEALEYPPLCQNGVVKHEDYFNSGVLIMNLTLLRNEKKLLPNWLKVLEKNPQYGKLADQDTLNYYFSTRILKLPLKFNDIVFYARKKPEVTLEKKIYHFAAQTFSLDMNDPFNRLWMKYFIKTPFFDEDSIGRLYKSFEQSYFNLLANAKDTMINLSAVMSGKARAFFCLSQDVDALKKKFYIRDDEEIISADDEHAIQNLVYAMGKSQGKKIFLILVPNFLAVSELLEEIEFFRNRDFLNGLVFLLKENEVAIDLRPLIKAL